jgi:hypothetical protein
LVREQDCKVGFVKNEICWDQLAHVYKNVFVHRWDCPPNAPQALRELTR